MIKFSDNGIHLLKYQPNRRQLTVTLRNQYHLPNRHVFMECTMAHLDEQNHLLHERLKTSYSTSSGIFCKILCIKENVYFLKIFKSNFTWYIVYFFPSIRMLP
jgi:hypothetical protein